MSAEHVVKYLENLAETADERETLREAIDYAACWIPRKVVYQGQWDETLCPRCKSSLSHHEGDGCYVDRDWLEYCPNDECHQKLDWSK